jgi:DNA repair protein RecO (recombination protein O)
MKKTSRSKIGTPETRLGAVVLARANSGEADLVVTFLTRELGLVTALAKNARHSLKRFGGGLLSPGRAAWYYFRIRPNADLAFVARGENNPQFPLMPPEPVALALSAWAVELVRSMEAPRNPAELSFNLLVRHLFHLARCSDFTVPALEARRLSLGFTKCYLEIAGFGPNLQSCHECGLPPETGTWVWDPTKSLIYCPQCRQDPNFSVPGELLKLLGDIHNHTQGPRITPHYMARSEYFFAAAASQASDRTYKSRQVLMALLNGQDPAA